MSVMSNETQSASAIHSALGHTTGAAMRLPMTSVVGGSQASPRVNDETLKGGKPVVTAKRRAPAKKAAKRAPARKAAKRTVKKAVKRAPAKRAAKRTVKKAAKRRAPAKKAAKRA